VKATLERVIDYLENPKCTGVFGCTFELDRKTLINLEAEAIRLLEKQGLPTASLASYGIFKHDPEYFHDSEVIYNQMLFEINYSLSTLLHLDDENGLLLGWLRRMQHKRDPPIERVPKEFVYEADILNNRFKIFCESFSLYDTLDSLSVQPVQASRKIPKFELLSVKRQGIHELREFFSSIPELSPSPSFSEITGPIYEARKVFLPYLVCLELWLKNSAWNLLPERALTSFFDAIGLLREDPWFVRQSYRSSIVMSALATELLARELCQELGPDVKDIDTLGPLLRQLKDELPAIVYQGVKKTNEARILAVHPKGIEPSYEDAMRAILGATRFYIWNYYRREK